ncbi:MAG: hypothetical protein ACM3PY_03495 [Omnitrophica WOR_2 bacterium]
MKGIFDNLQQVLVDLLKLQGLTLGGGELSQHFFRVIFTALETPVDIPLDAPAQRGKKHRDDKVREHRRERRLVLSGHQMEELLQQHDTGEVNCRQGKGQCAVDQRTPDDDIDFIEPAACGGDGEGGREREARNDNVGCR